jgi:hypothetical protein
MKLETRRNNQDGSITVKGDEFCVVIHKDGRVRCAGKFTIEEQAETFFENAGVYANPDLASPRSRPSAKKRGSK